MGQQCGQTWLKTFSEINGLYHSGKQLSDLQLVTWNDYEEGTEIESGIDNCLTLAGSVSGNTLQWTISGDESTVDHYTAYLSSDGQNLMPLTDLTSGTHSLNLCSFSIPSGNYKLFVQAVGKPTLANQISGALSYSAACSATETATVSLSASPSSVTIGAGQSGSLTIVAQPQSGSFNGAISLSCTGIPSTLSCSFSPGAITPGAAAASSTLTISAASVTGASLPLGRNLIPIYAGSLFPLGIATFALGGARRRRRVRTFALIAIAGIGIVTASCGGGSAGTQRAAVNTSANYSVTVHGNSNSTDLSTTVNVIVP
jgi:hypothetical protein